MRQPTLYLLGLVAIGCGTPKIDATSDESAKSSVAKVVASVPEADREKLSSAIMLVSLDSLPRDKGLLGLAAAASTANGASLLRPLNGKTAAEILAEADRIRAERAGKEHAQLAAEVTELDTKRASAAEARVQLDKFEVSRSRFYKRERPYSTRTQPVIELTVKNGTGKAVAKVYFTGTIATPGRAVPWLRQGVNYEISGGLEAGEGANWELEPNMFSEWGTVDAPADAVLTVSVDRLDGADGTVLYDASWSSGDQERLDALKSKL